MMIDVYKRQVRIHAGNGLQSSVVGILNEHDLFSVVQMCIRDRDHPVERLEKVVYPDAVRQLAGFDEIPLPFGQMCIRDRSCNVVFRLLLCR